MRSIRGSMMAPVRGFRIVRVDSLLAIPGLAPPRFRMRTPLVLGAITLWAGLGV